MLDCQEMRKTYCDTLLEEMEKNNDVVIFEADLMGASGTKVIQDKYPERHFNVGIAESNMVSAAAGMSSCGKIPVCHTFAAFCSRRAFDQSYISVAYAGLNVKLVGSDPGVSAEHNGGTHMAFEDLAIMRSIPTMTVFEPADCVQMKKAIPVMLNTYGPMYMRMYRRVPHKIYDDDYEFVLGKADKLKEGTDVTIIASGMMVWNSLEVARKLEEEGISVRVVNMHTIKPIDAEAIISAAKETGAIVTAENNNYINGLGSAVAEVMVENDLYVPMLRVGVKDEFGDVGTSAYLMERYHIAPKDIEEAVRAVLARKK